MSILAEEIGLLCLLLQALLCGLAVAMHFLLAGIEQLSPSLLLAGEVV